jgi:prepilin peptidase CpaA
LNALSVSLILFAVSAAVWDLLARRIPNAFSIAGAAAGVVVQVSLFGWGGLLQAVAGSAISFALALLVHVFGAIGAGDVKWFAAAGTMADLYSISAILGLSLLAGGIIGGCKYVSSKAFRERLHHLLLDGYLLIGTRDIQRFQALRKAGQARFPFMLCALIGVALVVTVGVPRLW